LVVYRVLYHQVIAIAEVQLPPFPDVVAHAREILFNKRLVNSS